MCAHYAQRTALVNSHRLSSKTPGDVAALCGLLADAEDGFNAVR
jgi:hypothetical protein